MVFLKGKTGPISSVPVFAVDVTITTPTDPYKDEHTTESSNHDEKDATNETSSVGDNENKTNDDGSNNNNDNNNTEELLLQGKHGIYNEFAAKILSLISGWSYSDFPTFQDKVTETTNIKNANCCMIQIKNEPMFIEATAQIILTEDKKTMIICFRGTEMTNLINWITDANTKKETISYPSTDNKDTKDEAKQNLRVHSGFKRNFEQVWFGPKGILAHILRPRMMAMDYNYDDNANKTSGEHDRNNELEAIYITGHSLGGAMAFLAGLYLRLYHKNNTSDHPVFRKLRGIYTYGSPMVIDPEDVQYCNELIGTVLYRHVYFNDVVPHLPPFDTGTFDHCGFVEYRFYPTKGWVQRKKSFFQRGRVTQIPSILIVAPYSILDGIIDNIEWLHFIKMPWSLIDHSPLGYINSLTNKDHKNDRGFQII